MRKRKEIEKELQHLSEIGHYAEVMRLTLRDNIRVELLLDIRELLILDSPYMQRLNLAKVKVISTQEILDEMAADLKDKYVHMCNACHVPMRFIQEYKNKSGAKFHTYQCPKCKGKIDYAQIKGPKGEVGEFSVHSNIVPKEAKKK